MDGSFWHMHAVRRRQHNCVGVLYACVLCIAKPVVSKHRWQIKALMLTRGIITPRSHLPLIPNWLQTERTLCSLWQLSDTRTHQHGHFSLQMPTHVILWHYKTAWSQWKQTNFRGNSEQQFSQPAHCIWQTQALLSDCVTVSEGINDLYHFWIIW